jgi:hypothetical protein
MTLLDVTDGSKKNCRVHEFYMYTIASHQYCGFMLTTHDCDCTLALQRDPKT